MKILQPHRPGEEVITTPMTFCATVESIIHCGATPVRVDGDRKTFGWQQGDFPNAGLTINT